MVPSDLRYQSILLFIWEFLCREVGRFSSSLSVVRLVGVACAPDKGDVEEEEIIDEDGDGVIAEEDVMILGSWVYPGAAETCDGIDNDCDGDVDEDLNRVYYIDNDGDGYGDETNSVEACEAPSGAVSDATDCDDAEAGIHPGATESCDDLDNDCDGSVDEDVPVSSMTMQMATATETRYR